MSVECTLYVGLRLLGLYGGMQSAHTISSLFTLYDSIFSLGLRSHRLIWKQTQVAGAENGSRATLHPQFGEDMAHMQLDRPWCHDQGRRNLLVGSPTGIVGL